LIPKSDALLTRVNRLIIINFDEHGGFADHVGPPVNIPAPQDGITFSGLSDAHNVTYDFTRLGVRSVSLFFHHIFLH
jgi:phospholipase C